MKLSQLSERLGTRLAGDGDIEITGVCGMESAAPGQLTFLANPKYAHKVKNTRASAILVTEPIAGMDIASLVSANPYHDFARALECFYSAPRPAPGVHEFAFIDPTATVGEDASIGPFAYVGPRAVIGARCILYPHSVVYEGAEIGDDFTLHAHAVVREFCRVGDRVVVQNGTVVGGDGFGFAKTKQGTHYKIPQSGITVIEDDVEIQALTAIDRATVGETRVKRGARIDNLVQIGHACVVGEDNIICSQVGLAGSTILEKNVLLAGQVGISGHLTVHDNAIVYAQSGVGHDVPAGSVISGSPAFDAKLWLRTLPAYQKLPEMLRTMRELEKRVAELETRGKSGAE